MITIYTDETIEDTRRIEHVLPERWRGKYKTFVFSSLRNKDQTYGYAVMPYSSEFFTRLKHNALVESLSVALQSVGQRMAIEKDHQIER